MSKEDERHIDALIKGAACREIVDEISKKLDAIYEDALCGFDDKKNLKTLTQNVESIKTFVEKLDIIVKMEAPFMAP